jgi:hypothetical protein
MIVAANGQWPVKRGHRMNGLAQLLVERAGPAHD